MEGVDDYEAFDRLARAVYLAARAGTVDCTAAFDLATAKLEVSPLDPDARELALLSVEPNRAGSGNPRRPRAVQ
jgi:hypothetical protein